MLTRSARLRRSLRSSGCPMCERCDAADQLGVQVDEAVAAEALPRVCSSPTCEGVPVMRIASSADAVDLLCAECVFSLGVLAGVRAMIDVIEPAGIRVDHRSAEALSQFTALRMLHSSEVL